MATPCSCSEKGPPRSGVQPLPYVVINMAMTADAKVATAGREVTTFGSPHDSGPFTPFGPRPTPCYAEPARSKKPAPHWGQALPSIGPPDAAQGWLRTRSAWW